MPEIKTKQGKQLREWRKKNNLSLKDLAEAMGYSRKSYGQVMRHEQGKKEIHSTHAWQNLMRWCAINNIKY